MTKILAVKGNAPCAEGHSIYDYKPDKRPLRVPQRKVQGDFNARAAYVMRRIAEEER